MKKALIIIKFLPVYILVSVIMIIIAQKGSDAITTYAETSPIADRKCIIIDAGHGGVDGGATSYSGVLESKINLEIALRLEDLTHLLGMDTKMIRRTDESIHIQGTTIAQKKVSDLRERVRIVNETKHGILVSIHQNHFTDSRYYGPQVFYKKGQGSEQFAKAMQTTLTTTLAPESNRKAKIAYGIYLMDKIECTGILIECGFLSNPTEDHKLNTDTYQKKMVAVIACVCSNQLYSANIS